MTILFRDDWNDYPTAIVDYNTTNDSFKKLVYLYKNMGIKNCEFPLALYQPELSGVDPFDETLSEELKLKIGMEVQYNAWYFFREVLRIPPIAGTVPVRFRANRGNIAMYWSFFNHIDFGLLQPRQTGKSVSTDGLMTGIMNAWGINTKIGLITKDNALRNENVERLKAMRNLLPEYIYFPNRLDADNSEIITNVKKNNSYKTAVGRNDKMSADRLGRGFTVPIRHFDELAYISLIEITMPVALASGTAARDEARDAEQLYGNIYTTTAGNINSRDGRYAHKFLTGGMVWSEKLMDLPDQKTLELTVEKGSTGLKPLIYGAFNHRQLGRSDQWLYEKLRESASYGEIADRDYMNIWTTGTDGSPLTPEEKNAVNASEMDVQYMELFDNGYSVRWYLEEREAINAQTQRDIILGLDPSEALGGENDAMGVVLLDPYTHDVLGTARINEANTTLMGIFIADLLQKYTKMTFIPERKSTGISILDTLFIQLPLRGIDPFKRIYNRIVDEQDGQFETDYKEVRRTPVGSRPAHFYDRYKRHFGFVTTGSGRNSRDALYVDALKSALRLGAQSVYDKALIGELLSLVIRNGRVDHEVGSHDDMVVAFLLCHWFCTKAKHLDYYGLEARRIFSQVKTRLHGQSPEDEVKAEVKRGYADRFNQLLEEFKTAKDPTIAQRLELQMRQLSGKFDINENTGVGIDAMLKQAQEERDRRYRVGHHRSGKDIRSLYRSLR